MLHAEHTRRQSDVAGLPAEPSSTPILPGTCHLSGLSGRADDYLSLVGPAPPRCPVWLPLHNLWEEEVNAYRLRAVRWWVCVCMYIHTHSFEFSKCVFLPRKQRVHKARQDYSHYIHTLTQADGKTDDPRSSHSGPSIFISWLLAHRLPVPITSPWVLWQGDCCRHTCTNTHARTHTHTRTLCFRNKVGMKKEASEKKERVTARESCDNPKEGNSGMCWWSPSRRLNNWTFIKDRSKSMCCCELLFMSKILVDAAWRDLSCFLECQ